MLDFNTVVGFVTKNESESYKRFVSLTGLQKVGYGKFFKLASI